MSATDGPARWWTPPGRHRRTARASRTPSGDPAVDRLPLAPTAGAHHAAVRSDGWGGRVVDGEQFHDGIDWRRSAATASLPRTTAWSWPPGRRVDDDGLGRGPRAVLRAARSQARLVHLPIVVVIDDGNGYRSISPTGKVVVNKGQTRPGRPAPGLRGRDRAGVRLPPALRAVQPWDPAGPSRSSRGGQADRACRATRSPGSIPLLVLPRTSRRRRPSRSWVPWRRPTPWSRVTGETKTRRYRRAMSQ